MKKKAKVQRVKKDIPPWITEVKGKLEACRIYPIKIRAIGNQIDQLREQQGFDLESRAIKIEINQLEQEKETLTASRELMQKAVDMLPDNIQQFIKLYYLSDKQMTIDQAAEKAGYCKRNFYRKRDEALDLLAEYLHVKLNNS